MATSTGVSPDVQIIQAMITPALLILASGSLIATVLARVGRIVELVRKIAEAVKSSATEISETDRKLLLTLRKRAELAERAMIAYYAAVVCFVLTCLLIGIDRFVNHMIYFVPVTTAMIGVILVLAGSAFMVSECRVAMHQLRGEIDEVNSHN